MGWGWGWGGGHKGSWGGGGGWGVCRRGGGTDREGVLVRLPTCASLSLRAQRRNSIRFSASNRDETFGRVTVIADTANASHD